MKVPVQFIQVDRLAQITEKLEADGFIDPASRKAFMADVHSQSETINVTDEAGTELNDARNQTWLKIKQLFKDKADEIQHRIEGLTVIYDHQREDALQWYEHQKEELRELYHKRAEGLTTERDLLRALMTDKQAEPQQRYEASQKQRIVSADIEYHGKITHNLVVRAEIKRDRLLAEARQNFRDQQIDLLVIDAELRRMRAKYLNQIESATIEALPQIYQDARSLLAGVTLP